MKTQMRYVLALACALLLATANHAAAQVSAQKTAADLFNSVKPGQWLELQGPIQKDNTVTAKKVRILTGDFQDDDWEIKGPVRMIEYGKKEFHMLVLPVTVTDQTEYESAQVGAAGGLTKFNDIKNGMVLECEGTYLKDGKFSAEEMQEETELKPGEANEFSAVGKVEKLDPVKRTVTVVGITFRVLDTTKVQSAIK